MDLLVTIMKTNPTINTINEERLNIGMLNSNPRYIRTMPIIVMMKVINWFNRDLFIISLTLNSIYNIFTFSYRTSSIRSILLTDYL